MTFDRFDVVIVPFPFTDRADQKRRPALVLSSARFNVAAGHSVMAMITSAGNLPWPLGCAISSLKAAGLPGPSVVRMKLFTLDHQFVLRKAGRLSKGDQTRVDDVLAQLFASNT